jgi:DNA-binding SARP family transcriptional activator
MSAIRFQLFGKFCVSASERELDLHAPKHQELLCYLLVHRDRPHPRETLASLLWGNNSTEKSKKYLRQALWQIQHALESRPGAPGGGVLVVENEWVQFNAAADLWLDVAAFERAFALAQGGAAGRGLEGAAVTALQGAVQMYRGDLLEGWYQDWCLFERERLQNIYFHMLDKLMGHCEATRDYEQGQVYGSLILRHDPARERTHRQLMQFHYGAGDRTAALRQYERCAAALDEELGVKPDRRTATLYQQIKTDDCPPNPSDAPPPAEPSTLSLPQLLTRLRRLQKNLSDAQQQLQQDIKAVELIVDDRH